MTLDELIAKLEELKYYDWRIEIRPVRFGERSIEVEATANYKRFGLQQSYPTRTNTNSEVFSELLQRIAHAFEVA